MQHLYAQTMAVALWVAIIIGLLIGLHLVVRAFSIYTHGVVEQWRERCRYHDTQLVINQRRKTK